MYWNALLSITHWSPHRCMDNTVLCIAKNWTEYMHCANKLTYMHQTQKKVNLQWFGKPVLFREQNKFFGYAYICMFSCWCCCILYLFIYLFIYLAVCLCKCCVYYSQFRQYDHFMWNWPLETSATKKVCNWKCKWKYAQKIIDTIRVTRMYYKFVGLNPLWILMIWQKFR